MLIITISLYEEHPPAPARPRSAPPPAAAAVTSRVLHLPAWRTGDRIPENPSTPCCAAHTELQTVSRGPSLAVVIARPVPNGCASDSESPSPGGARGAAYVSNASKGKQQRKAAEGSKQQREASSSEREKASHEPKTSPRPGPRHRPGTRVLYCTLEGSGMPERVLSRCTVRPAGTNAILISHVPKTPPPCMPDLSLATQAVTSAQQPPRPATLRD